MDKKIWEKANHWANNSYFDQQSRKEIQKLIDTNNEKELTERFFKDLDFGTGGLRSIIGMGSNRINKYTIRKAIQALSTTLQKYHPNENITVTVSYDSRLYSKEFAEESCGVLAANNITAYLYPYLNAVPLLSYAVRYKKAHAGIMITASHNPVEYNGLKVYWSDGCQVTPPIDQDIIEAYNKILDFSSIEFISFTEGIKNKTIQYLSEDVENTYFQTILSHSLQLDLCQKRGHELKIVFTPLHGTGTKPCMRALEQIGLSNVFLVKEQAQPDPRFSTLTTSPNPEIPEALLMATELLKKEKADIAFGTDPDTDRLGVVINHQNELHYLTGNQLAILLLHYIISQKSDQGSLGNHPLIIKTIVTTELLTTIAKHYKAHVENTLTGFKWMCGRLAQLEKEKPHFYQFLFASEESFGYLTHQEVRDKDAVSALAITAEMGLWYKTQGQTLIDALNNIYEQFGFSYESLLSLNYEGKAGGEKIDRIMESFRSRSEDSFGGEKILAMEDYLNGTMTYLDSGKKFPIDLPKSNVIGLTFVSHNKIYLRPSGTEPKIKFYLMIQENEGTLEERKQKAAKKGEMFESLLKNYCEKI